MGAGPPVIGPGYNLPGAEYFALAPNRSIALGPRLTTFAESGVSNVPAGEFGAAQVQAPLVTRFQTSSAIYLVRAFAIFVPGDGTGELQIASIRFALQPPTTFPAVDIFLDIGIPLAIFTAPPAGQVVIQERDALITGLDLGPTWVPQTQLNLLAVVSVKNNDATNPHSFRVATQAVYHSVEGFVQ